MTLLFIRGFFLIISLIVGYYIGSINGYALYGVGIGGVCGVLLIVLESGMRRVSVRGLSSMVFGLLLGLIIAHLISEIISVLPLGTYVHSVSRVVLTLIFSYMGAVMAIRGNEEFNIIIPYVRFRRQDIHEEIVILDSSALVDGRIADIYKSKFFNGRLLVPRFVLHELQKLADSQDDLKRQKGRRGLDILEIMQKDSSVDLKIHDEDIPGDLDVDTKLVRLAKLLDAKVCTTDYNLSRVASIESVGTLNINDLANAVRAVVFPGEELHLRLIKPGKESHQALGYLEDGTMVVVAEAKNKIGQKVSVKVTSVLQTQAGRMIFAK